MNEILKNRLDKIQKNALIAGGVGMLICVLGVIIDHEQFFRSYLTGYIFWLGIALGSFGIYMLYHLVGGAWGYASRRLLSATIRSIPVLAILFIPLLFGLPILYPWARPEAANDPLLVHKSAYLNVPFFIIRAAICFGVWILWPRLVFAKIRVMEKAEDRSLIRPLQNIGAAGLMLLFLTVTIASIDWLMSLEPHWFSTIYGMIYIAGFVLSALSFTAIMLYLVSQYEPISRAIRPQMFHDLGNLMFAFTMLWAYVSFSQLLIIWSGNIAEETPWYIHRLHGGWEILAYGLIALHFAAPFLILLSRKNKRNPKMLARIAGFILLMRLLEYLWQIAPSFHPGVFYIHWLDVAAPMAVGGFFIAYYIKQLQSRPLLAPNDPRRYQALAHIEQINPDVHIEREGA